MGGGCRRDRHRRRRGRGGVGRFRYHGGTKISGGCVIDVIDCPNCDGTGRVASPLRTAEDCAECDGTAEVYSETVIEGFPARDEASALANRRAADHEAPPCCFTPHLCGGPHEDCYDALRAEEAVRMEAEAVGIADAVARLHDALDEAEHVCDAPHPYCSRDGHADTFPAPDQDR